MFGVTLRVTVTMTPATSKPVNIAAIQIRSEILVTPNTHTSTRLQKAQGNAISVPHTGEIRTESNLRTIHRYLTKP